MPLQRVLVHVVIASREFIDQALQLVEAFLVELTRRDRVIEAEVSLRTFHKVGRS